MSATAPTASSEFDRARLSRVERGLRVFTDVRPGEGRTALLMFANVFLILCAYYFIKPLREGWLAVSGVAGLSKLELRAYTAFGQSLLLIPVVAGYGRLVGRWPRAVLVERATLFCMANMLVFWALQPGFLAPQLPYVGIAFYLWVGMFAVFVVAQFWAFAADLYTEERGNRLLPMIAIGATAGAAVGSLLLEKLVSSGAVPTHHVLLMALVPLAASIWLTRSADVAEGGVALPAPVPVAGGSAPADRRGALRLVFGSRYLLAIGVIMLITNWVKTNGENQLYEVVQQTLQRQVEAQGLAGDAIKAFVKENTTAFYGGFYFWVNAIALGLQALVASRILKYGGFGLLFLLLPVIALLSYSTMVLLPLLAVVRTTQAAVNATDYSINNTARHVLWLPMSQSVTFKGKPTVDSLFVRAGDGMAAVTVLLGVQLLSASIRTYLMLNVALALVWLVAAAWVAREHGRILASTDEGGVCMVSRGTKSLLERTARGALAIAFVAASLLPAGARAGSNLAAAQGALMADMASAVRVGLKDQILLRDAAPLWAWVDPDLEEDLVRSMDDLGLEEPLREKKLAIALVDITDIAHPRVAALNGDTMLYAASLPKIAVMLGVFEKAAEGKLVIDDETREELRRMIRRSSNSDATALMQKVGLDYIARTLISSRYRLYDPFRNGGLWAGKEYASVGAWRRDPIDNLSHGATPMQIARFYYMLQTGKLVNPQASAEMKELLGHSAIHHKFVRGLEASDPTAVVYRKSGTWGISHADGALVERRDGSTFIAAGIAEDPRGGEWLSQIIIQMDRLISSGEGLPRVRRTNAPGRGGDLSVSSGG